MKEEALAAIGQCYCLIVTDPNEEADFVTSASPLVPLSDPPVVDSVASTPAPKPEVPPPALPEVQTAVTAVVPQIPGEIWNKNYATTQPSHTKEVFMLDEAKNDVSTTAASAAAITAPPANAAAGRQPQTENVLGLGQSPLVGLGVARVEAGLSELRYDLRGAGEELEKLRVMLEHNAEVNRRVLIGAAIVAGAVAVVVGGVVVYRRLTADGTDGGLVSVSVPVPVP